jgi:SpoVK/Ycf46/Vps4 family AAA+-type ATPase
MGPIKSSTKPNLRLPRPRIVKKTISQRTPVKPTKDQIRKENALLPDLPFPVTNWKSLMELAHVCKSRKYRDCGGLPSLLPVLLKIDDLVGLEKIKGELVVRILYYCQRYKIAPITHLRHVVLQGPPGCGKTTLAFLLADLFILMGDTQDSRVIIGNRSNMIGSYVGHTAKNTQAVIDSAKGGVLLIDEAYSLADGRSHDSTDSYSKACLDTLNQNLDQADNDFVCIVVGYQKELQRDFFNMNAGMKRRFPWCYQLDKYTSSELACIFEKLCQKHDLDTARLETEKFFAFHYQKFQHQAASVVDFTKKLHMIICRESFGLVNPVPLESRHLNLALTLGNV